VGPLAGRESAAGHDVGADANERFDPIGQIDEPEADRRGYLDQDVHVAVLPLVGPRVRAKESQPRDPELPGQTWPCLMEYAKNVLHLVDAVLPWVPVRQWVLTVPYRLRYQMAWNHGLSRAVLRVYTRVLLERVGERRPGVWH
jgi:hypothetical protein